ncbi:MAG: Hydrolase, alpha/beta fold family [Ktedonobacterales bacterium]|jgi:pimeloyl-ACP methyl ester carboxylesterase|nr:MAG: Hydrolase, alpha/beta fold family [Ktedonobacterales bacterium]
MVKSKEQQVYSIRRWFARWGWRRVALVAGLLMLFAWALAPAARGVTLVANRSGRGAPDPHSVGMPVREVHFAASDGVRLAGWLAMASPNAPSVILVHGFKGRRADMLPWARFLYAAGYNVLLYDSRGCGESDGWGIGLGATEPDDVIGAVRYLESLPDLRDKRFGVLGVSLGAGDALLAAAREPAIAAVVADSAWTDQQPQISRMTTLPFGPVTMPALPYEPALVDALIGARLEDARPLAVIGQISPRAVLLIASADDTNALTPLAGEQKLFAAAGNPKAQWIAPSGGHAGALAAHSAEYEQHVLAFFAQYLR